MRNIITALLIVVAFSVQAQKKVSDTSITLSGNYISLSIPPVDKIDTVFGVFLEIPSGYQLNPSSWSIESQSEIDLKWCRGFAITLQRSFRSMFSYDGILPFSSIDGYLYMDKKTKVKNRVIIFYEIKQ